MYPDIGTDLKATFYDFYSQGKMKYKRNLQKSFIFFFLILRLRNSICSDRQNRHIFQVKNYLVGLLVAFFLDIFLSNFFSYSTSGCFSLHFISLFVFRYQQIFFQYCIYSHLVDLYLPVFHLVVYFDVTDAVLQMV